MSPGLARGGGLPFPTVVVLAREPLLSPGSLFFYFGVYLLSPLLLSCSSTLHGYGAVAATLTIAIAILDCVRFSWHPERVGFSLVLFRLYDIVADTVYLPLFPIAVHFVIFKASSGSRFSLALVALFLLAMCPAVIRDFARTHASSPLATPYVFLVAGQRVLVTIASISLHLSNTIIAVVLALGTLSWPFALVSHYRFLDRRTGQVLTALDAALSAGAVVQALLRHCSSDFSSAVAISYSLLVAGIGALCAHFCRCSVVHRDLAAVTKLFQLCTPFRGERALVEAARGRTVRRVRRRPAEAFVTFAVSAPTEQATMALNVASTLISEVVLPSHAEYHVPRLTSALLALRRGDPPMLTPVHLKVPVETRVMLSLLGDAPSEHSTVIEGRVHTVRRAHKNALLAHVRFWALLMRHGAGLQEKFATGQVAHRATVAAHRNYRALVSGCGYREPEVLLLYAAFQEVLMQNKALGGELLCEAETGSEATTPDESIARVPSIFSRFRKFATLTGGLLLVLYLVTIIALSPLADAQLGSARALVTSMHSARLLSGGTVSVTKVTHFVEGRDKDPDFHDIHSWWNPLQAFYPVAEPVLETTRARLDQIARGWVSTPLFDAEWRMSIFQMRPNSSFALAFEDIAAYKHNMHTTLEVVTSATETGLAEGGPLFSYFDTQNAAHAVLKSPAFNAGLAHAVVRSVHSTEQEVNAVGSTAWSFVVCVWLVGLCLFVIVFIFTCRVLLPECSEEVSLGWRLLAAVPKTDVAKIAGYYRNEYARFLALERMLFLDLGVESEQSGAMSDSELSTSESSSWSELLPDASSLDSLSDAFSLSNSIVDDSAVTSVERFRQVSSRLAGSLPSEEVTVPEQRPARRPRTQFAVIALFAVAVCALLVASHWAMTEIAPLRDEVYFQDDYALILRLPARFGEVFLPLFILPRGFPSRPTPAGLQAMVEAATGAGVEDAIVFTEGVANVTSDFYSALSSTFNAMGHYVNIVRPLFVIGGELVTRVGTLPPGLQNYVDKIAYNATADDFYVHGIEMSTKLSPGWRQTWISNNDEDLALDYSTLVGRACILVGDGSVQAPKDAAFRSYAGLVASAAASHRAYVTHLQDSVEESFFFLRICLAVSACAVVLWFLLVLTYYRRHSVGKRCGRRLYRVFVPLLLIGLIALDFYVNAANSTFQRDQVLGGRLRRVDGVVAPLSQLFASGLQVADTVTQAALQIVVNDTAAFVTAEQEAGLDRLLAAYDAVDHSLLTDSLTEAHEDFMSWLCLCYGSLTLFTGTRAHSLLFEPLGRLAPLCPASSAETAKLFLQLSDPTPVEAAEAFLYSAGDPFVVEHATSRFNAIEEFLFDSEPDQSSSYAACRVVSLLLFACLIATLPLNILVTRLKPPAVHMRLVVTKFNRIYIAVGAIVFSLVIHGSWRAVAAIVAQRKAWTALSEVVAVPTVATSLAVLGSGYAALASSAYDPRIALSIERVMEHFRTQLESGLHSAAFRSDMAVAGLLEVMGAKDTCVYPDAARCATLEAFYASVGVLNGQGQTLRDVLYGTPDTVFLNFLAAAERTAGRAASASTMPVHASADSDLQYVIALASASAHLTTDLIEAFLESAIQNVSVIDPRGVFVVILSMLLLGGTVESILARLRRRAAIFDSLVRVVPSAILARNDQLFCYILKLV